MAVPTIDSLTPAIGASMGRVLVEIAGTNFRQQSAPVAPSKVSPPSVTVLFGTEPALNVKVVSDTRLIVLAPPRPPGLHNVVIENIDDTGAPIAGELVSLTDGYEAKRPELVGKTALTRLVETMGVMLENAIVPEVVWSAHMDYDRDTGDALNITDVASLPALQMVGPRMPRNLFYERRGRGCEQLETGDEFATTRSPRTHDLVFDLRGFSNNPIQLLAMFDATLEFFSRTKRVAMDRDPLDPGAGRVEYRLSTSDQQPELDAEPNSHNICMFEMGFRITGFNFEGLSAIPGDGLIDRGHFVSADEEDIVIQTAQVED